MKPDEMVILKATSFKLDNEKMCIVTYQYHVERDENGKVLRSKSRYRWLARVLNIADARAKVAWYCDDCRRLDKWYWPNDPSWDGCIALNDSSNDKASAWLNCRLKKLVDWEHGQRFLKGWKNIDQDFSKAAEYDTEGYQTEDGQTISLTNLDDLKKQLNKNIWKELPRNVKAKEREKELEALKLKTGPGKDVISKAEYDKLTPEQKKIYFSKPKDI